MKDTAKCHFWQAITIVSEAMDEFAKRYAEKARLLADKEINKRRKGELKRIAEICSRVPGYPARTFYEAVQSIWFTHLVTMRYVPTDIGRLDQYLNSYYESDLKQGLITKESAQELIDCLWLKLAENWRMSPKNQGLPGGGYVEREDFSRSRRH